VTPQPSPFDSFVAPEPPARSHAAATADQEPERQGPSYTWLHYIILVVVAFGLGWLLWQVIAGEKPSFTPDDAAGPAVAITATATMSPRGIL
jgi:cytoskeletal protein RodZ